VVVTEEFLRDEAAHAVASYVQLAIGDAENSPGIFAVSVF